MITRILLVPTFAVLTVLRLIIDLVVKISGWFFYAAGGIILLTAVLSFCFQLEKSAEVHRMVITAGVLFLLPQGASILSGILEVGSEIIGDRIRVK